MKTHHTSNPITKSSYSATSQQQLGLLLVPTTKKNPEIKCVNKVS